MPAVCGPAAAAGDAIDGTDLEGRAGERVEARAVVEPAFA
jgi:hypothetical protein